MQTIMAEANHLLPYCRITARRRLRCARRVFIFLSQNGICAISNNPHNNRCSAFQCLCDAVIGFWSIEMKKVLFAMPDAKPTYLAKLLDKVFADGVTVDAL